MMVAALRPFGRWAQPQIEQDVLLAEMIEVGIDDLVDGEGDDDPAAAENVGIGVAMRSMLVCRPDSWMVSTSASWKFGTSP